MDDDLETIKTNMIKLQKRNEELEEENAKLKAGTMLREADEEIKRLKSAAARQKEPIVERNATIDRMTKYVTAIKFYARDHRSDRSGQSWNMDRIIELANAALEPNRTEAEIVGKEEDET